MANTYTQIYIQCVFAVKFRKSLIRESIRVETQKYISGIISNQGHLVIAIYCMPDHCHILIGLNPKQSLSDLMRDVKASSSKWINEKGHTKTTFRWQEGFGAFTYELHSKKNIYTSLKNMPLITRKSTSLIGWVIEVPHDNSTKTVTLALFPDMR